MRYVLSCGCTERRMVVSYRYSETDRLSRNVGKKIPLRAAWNPQTAQISSTTLYCIIIIIITTVLFYTTVEKVITLKLR